MQAQRIFETQLWNERGNIGIQYFVNEELVEKSYLKSKCKHFIISSPEWTCILVIYISILIIDTQLKKTPHKKNLILIWLWHHSVIVIFLLNVRSSDFLNSYEIQLIKIGLKRILIFCLTNVSLIPSIPLLPSGRKYLELNTHSPFNNEAH